MYVSDARTPMPSLYTKALPCLSDIHFGAMQPCSSGLGMTLEASDFRSVRRLVAYTTCLINFINFF